MGPGFWGSQGGVAANMEEILFLPPLPSPAHSAGRQIFPLPGRVFEGSVQEPDVKSPRGVEWASLVLSILEEVPQEIGSSFHNLVLDDEHLPVPDNVGKSSLCRSLPPYT